MSVQMTLRVPHMVSLIFRAFERGDSELGDALFGAVERRADAIEASLTPLRDSFLPPKEKK